MKKNTISEYGTLLVAILSFIISSWLLFKYFIETIESQAPSAVHQITQS